MQPGTNKQVVDNSILDKFGKQTYLGNSFNYSLPNQEITTTSEFPLILLNNPAVSDSAFPSGYKSLFVNLQKLICITPSQNSVLRVYLNPTATAGTEKTPINLRPQNSNTSISDLSLNPTASSNGTLISVLSALPGQSDFSDLLSVLDPGNSMLITAQTSSNATFIGTELSWYEL